MEAWNGIRGMEYAIVGTSNNSWSPPLSENTLPTAQSGWYKHKTNKNNEDVKVSETNSREVEATRTWKPTRPLTREPLFEANAGAAAEQGAMLWFHHDATVPNKLS